MIVDKELELSLEQAVTVTAASTDYLDLGAVRDPGMSEPMHIAVTVTEAAAAAGAATVQFQLQKDVSDPAFGSVETVQETPAIGKATLVAGYQQFIPIPPGIDARYVRLNYVVATGPLTAGKFTAQLVKGIQKNVAYPDAL